MQHRYWTRVPMSVCIMCKIWIAIIVYFIFLFPQLLIFLFLFSLYSMSNNNQWILWILCSIYFYFLLLSRNWRLDNRSQWAGGIDYRNSVGWFFTSGELTLRIDPKSLIFEYFWFILTGENRISKKLFGPSVFKFWLEDLPQGFDNNSRTSTTWIFTRNRIFGISLGSFEINDWENHPPF